MERVERMNVAIVHPNQQVGFVPWWDLYAINVDRKRNCCGRFGHLAQNCRRQIIG